MEFDCIIFDIDGTIYFQNKLRFAMAISLVMFYVIHFFKIKELWALLYFRQLREKKENRILSYQKQISLTAQKFNMDENNFSKVCQVWLFEKPLRFVKKYENHIVTDFLKESQKDGTILAAYSDYDPIDKLKVLEIEPQHIFYPNDNQVDELKPSKKFMNYIVSSLNVPSEKILYIGDRPEKDGKSAAMVNMKYANVKGRRIIYE